MLTGPSLSAMPFVWVPSFFHSMTMMMMMMMITTTHGHGRSGGGGGNFQMEFYHRSSEAIKKWVPPSIPSEEKGTVEYYSAMAARDFSLRGPALDAGPTMTFSGGNITERVSSMGFLHYAMVSLGTPTITFMVALDTGSDLFWLPCCDSAANATCPSAVHSTSSDFPHLLYNPTMSLTSKRVPYNSGFCDRQSGISESIGHCPYKIMYESADTSSSGTLIEDVLYLTTEDARPVVVEARIIFGCGQVQTGSVLDAAALNGLFGLGMENISVPSILSSNGLTSDSFSMCFGHDGIGRISFGDQGSLDQEETPFILDPFHPTYSISITGMLIGTSSVNLEISALVDSGTSFTYLTDPAYTSVSENFNEQVQDNRHKPDARIPFEYCYHISSNDPTVETPAINLTTGGGSHFPVSDPIIVITIQQYEYVYCLAILKSNKLNIIGQNFMTGLRMVFDRERLVLGWKKSNCYDAESSKILPLSPWNSSSTRPEVSDGATEINIDATKGTGNSNSVWVLTPPFSNSSDLNRVNGIILILLLLFYLIVFLCLVTNAWARFLPSLQ